MIKNFYDGIRNLYNSLVNTRNQLGNNRFASPQGSKVDSSELRALYKLGLPRKIVEIKSGYALDDTLEFDNSSDKSLYSVRFDGHVKNATKLMLAFGRSIILLFDKRDLYDTAKDQYILSTPRTAPYDAKNVQIRVFSGDVVTCQSIDRNLTSERYNLPEYYMVDGQMIHHSRVIDFVYKRPSEVDLPTYNYGGISEFELIYNQLITDAIVERSVASIIEKSSTIFYKVAGLKAAMQSGHESKILAYFQAVEDGRSLYGAGILDMDDDVTTVTQTLQHLSEASDLSLRRIAMVSSIAMTILIGEQAKGLNASGENELIVFQRMLEALQSDELLHPINRLAQLTGLGRIAFKDNQGQTANDKVNFDLKATQVANTLYAMGENNRK